jgi:hypothetical protein
VNRLRLALRTAATLIALAALLDPSLTQEVTRREPVTVVAVGQESVAAAARLRDRLGTDFKATTWLHDRNTSPAACPQLGACIIVSTGDVPERVSAGGRILGGMMVADSSTIRAIAAPARAHREATATLRVETAQPVQRVDVFDGKTLVGSAEPNGETIVDVPWVPLAEGARALHVVAGDESADVGVVVDGAPVPVLFYEPQATWMGTFVRRALEDDPRFTLNARARIAPPVTVTRGDGASLSAGVLEDANTVVVTAPELLGAQDVTLLELFVTRRGGSLIVLADRRPAGDAMRLLPRVAAERREPDAHAVGQLRASEWLAFEPTAGDVVLAAIEQQPVIVARAVGRGRVVVSGALDAWRFRQANDGDFNTFWTTLAWEAAAAAGPRLRVVTDQGIAEVGEEVEVSAELQSLAMVTNEVTASGVVECSAARQPLRLWPGARPGAFTGTLRAESAGPCTITVTIDESTARVPLTIRDEVRRVPRGAAQLEALIAAHGGVLVTESAEDELVDRVQTHATDERALAVRWPMRSPLWLLPFVACLAGEWWLRRRSGLS